MPEKNNLIKNTESVTIKRKKFFIYSGSALLGLFAFLNIPSSLFRSGIASKDSTIKITENPNAVKRKSRQANNG
ncbi:MAG: hypothetical protein IPH77_06750 [Ignavibacteria bacterium]|nr:hypothetical protein [Ignavibacteria bacterium]